MFDYQSYFDEYCKTEGLDLILSFNMPEGYETANGTFDIELRTVYINSKLLSESPDYEKAFFLFHELRHAKQYLCPDSFSSEIIKSLTYTIMYDGTCYKMVDGEYLECKLDGGEELFTELYLCQPYEVDANTFAFQRAKEIYGDLEELKDLYDCWMPNKNIPFEQYASIYKTIDEKVKA